MVSIYTTVIFIAVTALYTVSARSVVRYYDELTVIRAQDGDYWYVHNESECIKNYRNAMADGKRCKCPTGFPHFYSQNEHYGCYASHEIDLGCEFTINQEHVANITRFGSCGHIPVYQLRYDNLPTHGMTCQVDDNDGDDRGLTTFDGIEWGRPSYLNIQHKNEAFVRVLNYFNKNFVREGRCINKENYMMVSVYRWIVGQLLRVRLTCRIGNQEIRSCLVGKAVGTHKHYIARQEEPIQITDTTSTTVVTDPPTPKTTTTTTTTTMEPTEKQSPKTPSATLKTSTIELKSTTTIDPTTKETPTTTTSTNTPIKSSSTKSPEPPITETRTTPFSTKTLQPIKTTLAFTKKMVTEKFMETTKTTTTTSDKLSPEKRVNFETKEQRNVLKIAIGIGVATLLVILFIVGILLYRRYKQKQTQQGSEHNEKAEKHKNDYAYSGRGGPSVKSTTPVVSDDIYMELDLNSIYEGAYCDLNNIRTSTTDTAVPPLPTEEPVNEPVYFETESDEAVYNEIPYILEAVYFETYPDPFSGIPGSRPS